MIFKNLSTTDLQYCVTVAGVVHSDLLFLWVILHYRLLQDNGYNSLAIQYTLVTYLFYIS